MINLYKRLFLCVTLSLATIFLPYDTVCVQINNSYFLKFAKICANECKVIGDIIYKNNIISSLMCTGFGFIASGLLTHNLLTHNLSFLRKSFEAELKICTQDINLIKLHKGIQCYLVELKKLLSGAITIENSPLQIFLSAENRVASKITKKVPNLFLYDIDNFGKDLPFYVKDFLSTIKQVVRAFKDNDVTLKPLANRLYFQTKSLYQLMKQKSSNFSRKIISLDLEENEFLIKIS